MSTGTRLLTAPTGGSYWFDAGSFSLELLLTGGPGRYRQFEILHSPADLTTWLTDSKLAAHAPLTERDLLITGPQLDRIRVFRDALWTVAAALAHGGTPPAAELERINDAVRPGPTPLIDLATRARRWAAPVTGDQVLGHAACDAVDLVTGDRTDRLRECGADDCQLLFLDTSRPGNRRWCSMQRCGNRTKVRSYRTRHGDEH